jgi:hypothetical protein
LEAQEAFDMFDSETIFLYRRMHRLMVTHSPFLDWASRHHLVMKGFMLSLILVLTWATSAYIAISFAVTLAVCSLFSILVYKDWVYRKEEEVREAYMTRIGEKMMAMLDTRRQHVVEVIFRKIRQREWVRALELQELFARIGRKECLARNMPKEDPVSYAEIQQVLSMFTANLTAAYVEDARMSKDGLTNMSVFYLHLVNVSFELDKSLQRAAA